RFPAGCPALAAHAYRVRTCGQRPHLIGRGSRQQCAGCGVWSGTGGSPIRRSPGSLDVRFWPPHPVVDQLAASKSIAKISVSPPLILSLPSSPYAYLAGHTRLTRLPTFWSTNRSSQHLIRRPVPTENVAGPCDHDSSKTSPSGYTCPTYWTTSVSPDWTLSPLPSTAR